MTALRYDSNGEDVARRLERFRTRLRDTELGKALEDLGQRWLGAMVRRVRSGSTPAGQLKASGSPTGFRTGRLARSFVAEVEESPEGPRFLSFGSRMPGQLNYARVQELGTVGKGGELPDIVPTRSKFLAVPLPAAFRGRSVSDPPRSYADTFIRPSKSVRGEAVIFQRRGINVEPIFALKKSVALEPRLGMRDTMREVFQRQGSPLVQAAIRRAAQATLSGGAA